MNLKDIGIDPKTGMHDRNLTTWESKFLGILWTGHSGENNAIGADEFAIRLDSEANHYEISDYDVMQMLKRHKQNPVDAIERIKRLIRSTQNHLLDMHGIPVYSKAGIGGGYYIGERKEEGDRFFNAFIQRAKTGMKKASRGRKSLVKKGAVQLLFQFEEIMEQADRHARLIADGGRQPDLVDVLDALIEQMQRNPEKYADGLRKIGIKYDSLFLSKDLAVAIKSKAAELINVLGGLNG